MRVKMRSTSPMRAESAGTKLPNCAIKTIKATCRRNVDLPDIFGPVIIRIRSPVSKFASLGTNRSALIRCSTTGCRPPLISKTSSETTSGRTYLYRAAASARLEITSRRAIIRAVDSSRPEDPLNRSHNSWNSRPSISWIRSSAFNTSVSYSFNSGVM